MTTRTTTTTTTTLWTLMGSRRRHFRTRGHFTRASTRRCVRRLEGASAKAVSHRSMRTAVARWTRRTTPHHACFDAWARLATAAGYVRRREESARRCEGTLMKPPSGRTDEETESVYELVRGSCELFEGCPRYEIVELCRRVRLERFARGDVLLSRGDLDDKVFIPVTGSVSQWMEPEREKEGERRSGRTGKRLKNTRWRPERTSRVDPSATPRSRTRRRTPAPSSRTLTRGASPCPRQIAAGRRGNPLTSRYVNELTFCAAYRASSTPP